MDSTFFKFSVVPVLKIKYVGCKGIDVPKNEPTNVHLDSCSYDNVFAIICTNVFVVFLILWKTIFKIILIIETLDIVKGYKYLVDVILLPW